MPTTGISWEIGVLHPALFIPKDVQEDHVLFTGVFKMVSRGANYGFFYAKNFNGTFGANGLEVWFNLLYTRHINCPYQMIL